MFALWVAVLLALAAAAPTIGAISNAQVRNPASTLATAALAPPGGLTGAAVGRDVVLGWTAGVNGDGYRIEAAANGLVPDCTAAGFATVGSTAGTGYTDAGRHLPQGTWHCHRVTTTYQAGWTNQQASPVVATQVGVVAVTVALANGGLAGTLDTGDRVVVTFNQAIAPASGPSATDTVCATLLGTVRIASATTGGACVVDEAVNLGVLSGVTVSAAARWSATYAWSNGNRTLTVTLGARVSGLLNPVVAGPWTFNPTTTSTRLLSATGSFHVCDSNSGGGNCLPLPSGAF